MDRIFGANKPEAIPPRVQPAKRYVGDVVYIYAFDVAYEMRREPLKELLGQPVAQFAVDLSKRSPKQLSFYRPQMVCLPPLERSGPHGVVRLERTIKLLPVGALSLSVRVPFAVDSFDELVAYHDLKFSNGSLHQEMRRLAEEAVVELKPFLHRPHPKLNEDEAYTVFCMEGPARRDNGGRMSAEDWLQAHRRDVAALLTQEADVARLSLQEAEESTSRYLSYYEDDLVVVDWDAALIIDERRDFDETIYVMELANLQLAELEAYDRILDDAVDRSYRDLRARPTRRRGQMLSDLREMRIDLARFSDELSNITKFFGDWHLARLYEMIAARFHLSDWHRSIDGKLQTLDHLYQLVKHDQTNRYMLWLEASIVVLFVIDILFLLLGKTQ